MELHVDVREDLMPAHVFAAVVFVFDQLLDREDLMLFHVFDAEL